MNDVAGSIIQALEQVIDIRHKYLQEKNYENHRYASKILKEEYEPAVKALKKILDNLLTEG